MVLSGSADMVDKCPVFCEERICLRYHIDRRHGWVKNNVLPRFGSEHTVSRNPVKRLEICLFMLANGLGISRTMSQCIDLLHHPFFLTL